MPTDELKVVARGFKRAFGYAKTGAEAVAKGAHAAAKGVDTGVHAAARGVGKGVHAATKGVEAGVGALIDASTGAARDFGYGVESVMDAAADETIYRKYHKLVARAERRLDGLRDAGDLLLSLGLDDIADDADDECDELDGALDKLRDRKKDLDKVIPECKALIEAIEKAASGYRNQAKNVQVTANVKGEDVAVFWSDIPGYDKASPEKRAELAEMAAKKVNRGKALFRNIVDRGEDVGPPTQKDVTDLVWALKTAAQQKASAYEKGALTVEGGEALRDYLDQMKAEVYPRISSHLPEKSKLDGQYARGIDFYDAGADDPDRMLPAAMNTLLYFSVKNAKGEDRLYVKMETEGMRVKLPGKKTDETMPEARALRAADVKNSVLHSVNWIKAELGKHSQDQDLDTYRENAPEALETQAAQVVKAAPAGHQAALKAALGKHLRINFFVKALAQALIQEQAKPDEDKAFVAKATAFVDAVKTYLGERDHAEAFGGEVNLSMGDVIGDGGGDDTSSDDGGVETSSSTDTSSDDTRSGDDGDDAGEGA